jgi:hypothetical protein
MLIHIDTMQRVQSHWGNSADYTKTRYERLISPFLERNPHKVTGTCAFSNGVGISYEFEVKGTREALLLRKEFADILRRIHSKATYNFKVKEAKRDKA